MLPIGTRPIIALIVDECLEAGVRDICFVISRSKEIIPQYFAQDEHLNVELKKRGKLNLIDELRKYDEVRFHVVYQDEQLGDGHAILQAADWVNSDEIAVLFGDDLFLGAESGLRQLIRANEQVEESERAIIAVENIPRASVNKYGIIDVASRHASNARLMRVKGLVEKPTPEKAPSTFGIVGRYIIPRSTIGLLRITHATAVDGEIRLIDALISQLDTISIFGLECDGKRIDVGTPMGYAETRALYS